MADSCSVNVMRHEFGHLLGLFHEHQRLDRDDYIVITHKKLLDPESANNLLGIAEDSVPIGPYNFSSLMHYPANTETYRIFSPKNQVTWPRKITKGDQLAVYAVNKNRNLPPSSNSESYIVKPGKTLIVNHGRFKPLKPVNLGILYNDGSYDGSEIFAEVSSKFQHGSGKVRANGSFKYTPDAEKSKDKDESPNAPLATVDKLTYWVKTKTLTSAKEAELLIVTTEKNVHPIVDYKVVDKGEFSRVRLDASLSACTPESWGLKYKWSYMGGPAMMSGEFGIKPIISLKLPKGEHFFRLLVKARNESGDSALDTAVKSFSVVID